MICPQCGAGLNESVAFCGDCGAAVKQTDKHSEASDPISPNAKVEILVKTAWKVLKVVIVNPVENIPTVVTTLKKREALETGLVFAALFDLCAVIGLFLLLPRWAGSPGLTDILKLLALGVVPPAAITGACILARKVFQGKGGGFEDDVFIAGVSFIPAGIVTLLSGLLGAANFEVVALVAVFALTYTILIIYTGCTQISRIPIVRAVPAVPTIIVIAGWLSKIAFSALI